MSFHWLFRSPRLTVAGGDCEDSTLYKVKYDKGGYTGFLLVNNDLLNYPLQRDQREKTAISPGFLYKPSTKSKTICVWYIFPLCNNASWQ